MKRTLFPVLCILIAQVSILQAQITGSYQNLKGTRLQTFLKTSGSSELGHGVALQLPSGLLPSRSTGQSRWIKFQCRGVRYLVRRNNPYWVQTQRKLRKSGKGKVLLKGRVRVDRRSGKRKTAVVFIDSIQKISGSKKKKRWK